MIVFRNPKRAPARTAQPTGPARLCVVPRSDEQRVRPNDLPEDDLADEDARPGAPRDFGAARQESVSWQMFLGLTVSAGIGAGFWVAVGWWAARLLK